MSLRAESLSIVKEEQSMANVHVKPFEMLTNKVTCASLLGEEGRLIDASLFNTVLGLRSPPDRFSYP